MDISVLASGSSGNSLVVSSGSDALLVDAGLSARRLQSALDEVGMNAEHLSGILVTHEHSDHVSGLGPVARRFGLPVFATLRTHEALKSRIGDGIDAVVIESGMSHRVGSLTASAFSVSHDCVDPVGYTIADGSHRVAIATDLGVVGRSVRHHLSEADCVVLEFNHDERMLLDGSYPWALKQRIMANTGHLSNAAAARELAALARGPLSVLILAHLSNDNNTPRLAFETAVGVLEKAGRSDIHVLLAGKGEALGPVNLGNGTYGRDRRGSAGRVSSKEMTTTCTE